MADPELLLDLAPDVLPEIQKGFAEGAEKIEEILTGWYREP